VSIPDEPGEQSVDVTVQGCNLASDKLDAFSDILRAILRHALPTGLHGLGGIYIVPDRAVEPCVNAMIKDVTKREESYRGSGHSHPAVAVPQETERGLVCFVVVGEGNLESIEPGQFPAEAASTLLEELLHVRLYTRTYQRRGYIMPRGTTTTPAIGQDMFVFCNRLTDEYIVTRWKTPILSDFGVRVEYARSLTDELEEAAKELARIGARFYAGELPLEDAWNEIIHLGYYHVLLPLARSAAYEAGREHNGSANDPSRSRFYREHVAPHWSRMKRGLERTFDSDLAETEVALLEIAQAVVDFFEGIGVRWCEVHDGGYWVEIKEGMLGSYLRSEP
jgi:hypothetical protein